MPFISSSKSCMWWPYCERVKRQREREHFIEINKKRKCESELLQDLLNSPKSAYDDMMVRTRMEMKVRTMTITVKTMTAMSMTAMAITRPLTMTTTSIKMELPK